MITAMLDKVAEVITRWVGTMYCAIIFAALAVVGFPGLLGPNALQYVLWTSTIFLQLVLLSILAVGQNRGAAAVGQKIDETHTASLAEFELAKSERADHLDEMTAIHELLAAVVARPTATPL